MTDADVSENATETPAEDAGVLAKLPRTRPQRASPRRAAARSAASTNGRPDLREANELGGRIEAARKPAASGHRTKKARATSGAKQDAAKRARSSSDRTPAPVADSAASTRAKSSSPTPRPSDAVRTKRTRTAKRPVTPRRAPQVEEPAPRQGYECEGERASGPVAPPGGPELVASAAEIVGELAKAGFSAGERLLKDVFSHLPGG